MTGIYSDGNPICASIEDSVSLDALTRRLHGNNAAVIEINASDPIAAFGGFSPRPYFRFCQGKNLNCIEFDGPGFRLSSLPPSGSYPLSTSPDVIAGIKELVTNGVDNYIQVIFYDGETPDPGFDWSKSGSESSFFRDPSVVSGGEDYVDLSGFELGDILVRYDRIGTETTLNNRGFEQTRWVFDLRIIFELAE